MPSYQPINRVAAYYEAPQKPTPPDIQVVREGCPHGCNCGYGEPDYCQCRRENTAIAIYGASFAAVLVFLTWLFSG